MMQKNAISWFEIPASDISRASLFYGKLFECEIPVQDLGDLKMAMFPVGMDGIGGAIVQHEAYTPSHQGTLVYFDCGADLSGVLSRVESAGGRIIKARTMISPDYGYMALFEDTEGNRMALHSRS